MLRLKHIPDPKWNKPARWKLIKDFHFDGVTVPKHFVTDGVTVPRIIYPLFNPTGKALKAAVVHDFLLSEIESGSSRKSADIAFKRALKKSGVSLTRRWTMYFFVRSYGVIKNAIYNIKRYKDGN